MFLSGFGPRGGKTAICNLVGGHGSLNMQICQFQGEARVSLGGGGQMLPPAPPERNPGDNPSKKKAAAHAYLALNRDNICAQKRAKYVLAEPKPDVKHM